MRSFLLRETSYFSITWAAKRSNCFEQVWHENIPWDVLLRLKFGQFIASHLMRCGVQILVVSSQFFSWMRWWIWCMDCEACKDEKVKIWKLDWKDIPINLSDMTHWACQKWVTMLNPTWFRMGQEHSLKMKMNDYWARREYCPGRIPGPMLREVACSAFTV